MDANYFANLIANAPIQSSSRYFEKGIYHVTIDGAKIFLNRQKRPRAAVECTVVSSNNPDFPETSQVSWIVSLDNDSGPGTIRSFICDVTGCEAAEASTFEVINKFFPNVEADPKAPRSVAAGLQALVHAFEKPTQSGGIYTKCQWRRFDPSKDEAPNFTPAVTAVHAETSSAAPVGSDPIPF